MRGMLFKQTPDLRVCSNPTCTSQETKEKTFLVCSLCRKAGLSVPYCSRGCQASDWPEHKKTCGVAAALGRDVGSGAKIEELVETKRPEHRADSTAPRKKAGAEKDTSAGEVWERVPDSTLSNID